MVRVKILAAMLLAALVVLAALAPAAMAHRAFVTLHDGRDYAQVQEHHHKVVVCDGSSNGHQFGVHVKLRGGGSATFRDSGASHRCSARTFDHPITDIQWDCHGERGVLKRA